MGVTVKIFQACSKFSKLSKSLSSINAESFGYLIKSMQNKCFNKEIRFQQNPSDEFPKLVNNLNLFLDNQGILRSRGRVGKCLALN